MEWNHAWDQEEEEYEEEEDVADDRPVRIVYVREENWDEDIRRENAARELRAAEMEVLAGPHWEWILEAQHRAMLARLESTSDHTCSDEEEDGPGNEEDLPELYEGMEVKWRRVGAIRQEEALERERARRLEPFKNFK